MLFVIDSGAQEKEKPTSRQAKRYNGIIFSIILSCITESKYLSELSGDKFSAIAVTGSSPR